MVNSSDKEIVLFTEDYKEDSRRLHDSLCRAGLLGQTYVTDGDGFLPEGVMSVYDYFLGDYSKKKDCPQRPLFFNEVTVPDFWDIAGTGSNAIIHDETRERGKIFYTSDSHKRLVRIVDWYDDTKTVRFSDHYNRFGAIFARTVFDGKGKKVNKTYFSPDGCPVIEENFVTKDILLNEDGKTRIFHSKTEFVMYFAKRTGLAQKRVFYNTLSTPFLVSERLAKTEGSDILFWQEKKRPDIPGNMKLILNRISARTRKIYVQDMEAYQQLLSLGASEKVLSPLGFIYPYERKTAHRKQVLICTNSDHIEHLKELVSDFPELTFHIAAVTEMSSKLMSVGAFENVRLYPNVRPKLQDKLFCECDIYLDANYGAEILNAGYRAFLNNQLIFAFSETVHQRTYIPKEHLFAAAAYDKLKESLQKAVSDESIWENELSRQRCFAMSEDEKTYQEIV